LTFLIWKAATIEVAAQKLSQLFNSPDPSPFAERDLDTEAAAFTMSWAKELAPCDRYRGLRHARLAICSAHKARHPIPLLGTKDSEAESVSYKDALFTQPRPIPDG
jgi:hypothetical protein